MNRPTAACPPVSSADRLVLGSGIIAPMLGEMTASFSRWFDQLDLTQSPWLPFDRWIRDTLGQFLDAQRVRCFHVREDRGRPVSLTNDLDDTFPSSGSIPGLIDHVTASGRRFVRGAPGNGEMVERLTDEWPGTGDAAQGSSFLSRAPDWVLPVRDAKQTIGLIIAGELNPETLVDLGLLQAVGHLLELYWRHVRQADALAIAQRTDRASGVLNRIDLTALADDVFRESASEGEPLVVVVLSVEGVRRLDDRGEWKLRDWLMQQIGAQMRRRLRSDDLIGRFSDDRFVAVLRRLDVALGEMIARKILAAVRETLGQQPAIGENIALRCGLADRGNERFDTVLVRAFDALLAARTRHEDIVVMTGAASRAANAPAGVDR